MKARRILLNRVVAAFMAVFFAVTPLYGDDAVLDDLFSRLSGASEDEAGRITESIWIEWSKSGSAAMDLLLERGHRAMADGQIEAAIEHFSALIDHAPDFAEGYNARATAYFQTGDFGPSIADIARTLDLNPRHFGALSGLGMIFEEIGRPQKALEAYRAAQAVNPHLAEINASILRLQADLAGQDL
jgi:tetratricopeptide (TPR) repeat protein